MPARADGEQRAASDAVGLKRWLEWPVVMRAQRRQAKEPIEHRGDAYIVCNAGALDGAVAQDGAAAVFEEGKSDGTSVVRLADEQRLPHVWGCFGHSSFFPKRQTK